MLQFLNFVCVVITHFPAAAVFAAPRPLGLHPLCPVRPRLPELALRPVRPLCGPLGGARSGRRASPGRHHLAPPPLGLGHLGRRHGRAGNILFQTGLSTI